jgi:hypothetical protein
MIQCRRPPRPENRSSPSDSPQEVLFDLELAGAGLGVHGPHLIVVVLGAGEEQLAVAEDGAGDAARGDRAGERLHRLELRAGRRRVCLGDLAGAVGDQVVAR